MRARMGRHLDALRATGAGPDALALTADAGLPELPPEFSWRDYAVFLLHIAAEVEHSLMVQYLYAAWSLGGPRVKPEHRATVAEWQRTILGIAKEEMGHLITVQNVLRLIGGPLNFEREDYPFRSEFYPFNFTLEPLTLDSLAKYVVAESPNEWPDPREADEIKARALQSNRKAITPVGQLYAMVITLLENRRYLRNSAFHAASRDAQASWGEWGRGHAGGPRTTSGPDDPTHTDLLIATMSTRQEAVEALVELAEQGEASDNREDTPPSHFERFLAVYKSLRNLDIDPSRPVARNPKTHHNPDEAHPPDEDLAKEVITDPAALGWAHLFNLRYRLLLVDLTHALSLAGPRTEETVSMARGSLVNWTIGEMYNLRAIGGILMECPLTEGGDPAEQAAGPPFDMPYTLSLPDTHADRWRLHRDLIDAAQTDIHNLQQIDSARTGFLNALAEADRTALERIDVMIAGA